MAIIEVSGLIKQFAGFTAVEDVSFSIEPGEVVALLGANGAGKTTTMRMLTGYFEPTAGVVRIGGHDVAHEKMQAQAIIGYLPEAPPIYPEMTVRTYLEFAAKLRGAGRRTAREQVARAMESCWLEARAEWVIGELSRGYRQRVGLAQAILADPKVLILDEPTSGLDPEQILMVRDLIAGLARDRTVLFSTHVLAEAQKVCHRALVMRRGKLVADETIDSLLATRGPVDEVLLHVRAEREEALSALAAVAGVRSIAADATAGKVLSLRITATRDPLLLNNLGQAVLANGWAIERLDYHRKTLEDAYLKLVADGPAAEATAGPGAV